MKRLLKKLNDGKALHQKAFIALAAIAWIVFADLDVSAQRLPTVVVTNAMLKQTILDFADAVEQESFEEFHAKSSEDFQATFTPDGLRTIFHTFIEKKDLVLPPLRAVKSKRAQFTKGPLIRTEKGYKILVANGSFATAPYKTNFEMEYIWTGKEWKLLTVKVSL